MAANEDPEYTLGEKLHIAGLVALGAKRSLAGENVYLADIDRKLDRIKARALKRADQAKE